MKTSLSKTIYENSIFCFLLLAPFIEPLYFTQIVVVDTVYYYWKLAAIFFVFVLWVSDMFVDKVIGSIILFLLFDCITTIIYNGNTSQMINNAITVIALCLLFSFAARWKSLNFLRVARLLFDILIIANLVVIVLFPDGIYNFTANNPHYFLGHKNVMMRTIFPGVCIGLLDSIVEKGYIDLRATMISVLAFASLVLGKSGTAMAIFAVFGCLLIVFSKRNLPKWLNAKFSCAMSVCIFVFIVLLGLQNLFSFVIVDILGKDLTLTGRTILWASLSQYITEKAMFGHGVEYLSVIAPKIYRYTEYDSAHNFFIDTLYQNGIVGMGLIVVVFITTAKMIDRHTKGEIKKVFTLILLVYGVMLNFEPFINGDLRLLLAIVIYMYYFGINLEYTNTDEVDSEHLLGRKRRKRIQFVFGIKNR